MLDAYSVLDGTDWTALKHAYGSAEDTPQALLALLSEDADLCADVLGYLDSAVLHQGSLYPATAPAAVFVAGILDDPRTMINCQSSLPWDKRVRPLRAALVEWLGLVARSASRWDEKPRRASEAEAAAACQALRRDLYDAVSPFVDDPDPSVRAATRSAIGHLLPAPELAASRGDIVELLLRSVRDADATERATIAVILGSCGESPRPLLLDHDPSVRAAAALAPSLDTDPDALAEIRLALADPARADDWFPTGVPHLGGRFRFALVQALLRRTREFDEIQAEAVAVADMTTESTVSLDWGPLLARAFALPYTADEPLTAAQRAFLTALADNDQCWAPISSTSEWFVRAGLPGTRESLRALIEQS